MARARSDAAALIDGSQARNACVVASPTQNAYRSYLNSIARWIQASQPDHERFFDLCGQVDVMVFTPLHFEEFLLSRFNDEQKKVKVVTLGGYRSAIKDLYRRQRLPIPVDYTNDLKTLFSELSRIEADRQQKGTTRTSGKAPLSYALYEQLCSNN
jgi:hypothetical protein